MIRLYFVSFNIKGGKEGPQLSTWPQGSTSVQTVIKYLEVAENSGQDLRYSCPWATSIPLGRSRWPSVDMPSLTFLLIIKSLPKTSFVTLEVQFAETCSLGLFYHDAPGQKLTGYNNLGVSLRPKLQGSAVERTQGRG